VLPQLRRTEDLGGSATELERDPRSEWKVLVQGKGKKNSLERGESKGPRILVEHGGSRQLN